MDIVIGFVLIACIVAALVAIFTDLALWIGLGLFVFCIFYEWRLRHEYDPSGDGGIAIIFGAIIPSLILSVAFLIAGGIKYLVGAF